MFQNGLNRTRDSARNFHEPVMVREVLDFLSPRPGGYFVDGTCGGASHSRAILDASAPDGRLLALDADPDAIAAAAENLAGYGDRVRLVEGGYQDMDHWMEKPADGILLDLGISSFQIDSTGRGFSFDRDGPLDMRFDRSSVSSTAAQLLNQRPVREIERIIYEYGEERHARRIARAIGRARSERSLATTGDLAAIVENAVPGFAKVKSKARVFQAIRIAVNGELDNLDIFLGKLESLLAPGGRLVALAYHSLEDARIKRAIVDGVRGCTCPPDFPECICGNDPFLERLTKKPVIPSVEEKARNSRSRSAKLRASVRTAAMGEES